MIGPFETHTASVAPGDQQQVSTQFEKDVVLANFVPDAGLELVRVVAGRQSIMPNPDKSFTFGQKVMKKAYVVAIVKNVTDQLIIGKGQWFVEGEGAAPAKQAQSMSGYIPMKEAPALRQERGGGGKDAKGRITAYPVGKNELAVAMSYGECKRLMDAISGGPPIATERAAYLRRFNQALAIFEGRMEPATESTTAPTLPSSPSEDRTNAEQLAGQLQAAKKRIEELEVFIKDHNVRSKTQLSDNFLFKVGYEKALEDLVEWGTERAQAAYDEAVKEMTQAEARIKETQERSEQRAKKVEEQVDINGALRVAPSLPTPNSRPSTEGQP